MLEIAEFTFERGILMFKDWLMLYLCHLFLLLFTTLFSINVFSVFYFIQVLLLPGAMLKLTFL